ncbi:hypothetical protein ACJX0J_034909, partial [Zea mays]
SSGICFFFGFFFVFFFGILHMFHVIGFKNVHAIQFLFCQIMLACTPFLWHD